MTGTIKLIVTSLMICLAMNLAAQDADRKFALEFNSGIGSGTGKKATYSVSSGFTANVNRSFAGIANYTVAIGLSQPRGEKMTNGLLIQAEEGTWTLTGINIGFRAGGAWKNNAIGIQFTVGKGTAHIPAMRVTGRPSTSQDYVLYVYRPEQLKAVNIYAYSLYFRRDISFRGYLMLNVGTGFYHARDYDLQGIVTFNTSDGLVRNESALVAFDFGLFTDYEITCGIGFKLKGK